MAEKKSWRDYSNNYSGDKSTDKPAEEKTGSWRDYSQSLSGNNTSKASWRDYASTDTGSIVGGNVSNRVNKWLKNHNSYLSGYQKRYSGRKYSYEDTYVSDSASWLDTVSKQADELEAERQNILSYIDQHKGYLDEDWVRKVRDTLTSARDTHNKIIKGATQDNEWWNSFGSEELVSKYGSAEEAYKAMASADKKYNDQLNLDTDAYAKELEDLGNLYDEAFTIDLWYNDYQRGLEDYDARRIEVYNRFMNEYGGDINALEKAYGLKERYLNEAKQVQAQAKEKQEYEKLKSSPDYMSKSASGWKSYEAQKIAEQQKEGGKSFWEQVAESYAYAPADTSLPAAAISNAAAAYRNDTTYREPNDKWSAEQKNHFGYLWSEDPSKAYSYAEQVNNQINATAQRDQQQAVGDWASQNFGTGILGTLGAIATAPLGMADFLDNIVEYGSRGTITQKGTLSPFDLGQAAQSGIANEWNGVDEYGVAHNVLPDWVPIVGGKGWGDVYSLGVSAANSLVSAYTLGGTGTLVNFIGQGGASGVDDALSRGATPEQALLYGSILGAAEGLTEFIPAEKLLKVGSSATLKNWLMTGLKQGIGEFAEEGVSAIIGNVADNIIMADKSNFNEIVRQLMEDDPNLTEKEAKKKAWGKLAGDVVYDAMGGFATGSINAMSVSGVKTLVDSRAGNNDNIKAATNYGDTEVQKALIKEGLASDPNSESYNLAKHYEKKVSKGKSMTGFEIRQLVGANEAQFVVENYNEALPLAKKRLADLGESGNIDKIADLVAKRASGQKLTPDEKSTLVRSQYGAKVAKEMTPESADLNYKSLESRVGTKGRFGVSESGKTVVRDTNEEIDIKKLDVATVGNGQLTFKLAEDREVSADGIDFADDKQSFLVSGISNIENITPAAATAMIHDIVDVEKPLGPQLNGIDESFTYGYHGYSESDLKAGNFSTGLTSQQMMSAYKLGQSARASSKANKVQAIKRMRTAVQAATEKAIAEGKPAPKSKGMSITYNYGNGKVVSIDEAEIKTAKQEGGIAVAKILQQMGLGTNVEFFSSKIVKDAKGNKIRVFVDDNGVEQKAYSGLYRKSDGTIRIDLNAYNGRGLTLNALSHELTHFVQQWSPEKYEVLAEFLVKSYEKTDMTMHDRVLREQDRLKRVRGEDVSYNEAYDEVVANAMAKMFDDGHLLDKLKELAAKDKTLVEKILEGIKEFLNKFLPVYEKQSALYHDTADIMAMKDTVEKLQSILAEALVDASSNYQTYLTASENQLITEAGIGFDEDTRSVYSLHFSTAYQNTIQVGKKTFDTEAISQVVAKGTGRSIEDARRWVQSELSIANMVMANPEFLDFEADNRYEAIKKNSDYPQGTVDLSNLCPKREEFTVMFDKLQKKYPNKLFTAQDIADMRKILAKNDITVACGACFVEDRRQLLGEIADTYINMWKEAVESGKPLQKTNAAGVKSDLLVTKALAKQYGLTAGSKIMATDTYIPNQYDLTTYEGFKLLEKNHPTIAMGFNRYNNSRGQQSARLIEGRAEYNRQILGWSDAKVRSVNNNGGLRIFSFSDFEVVHLLDLVQVIIDCAAKGVKIQGYTKIPAFAKLVRGTGIKLNRSLIPKGDYGYHMENGKVVLDYDTTEGIDINDDNFIDESSNPDVGNIVIGINPTQIGAAMLDPFIDYIIPFHSNKAKEILKKLGTGEWVNYKESQHEKDISTGKASKHNVNIYTEVINKYHPTNKVEFVEAFLKECKRQSKTPRYAEFLNVDENGNYTYREGYHKLLVDFKMFDAEGNILPQGNITPSLDENFMKELLNAEIDKKQSYEFPQKVYDAIDKQFGEQYSSQETDFDSEGNQLSAEQQKFFKDSVVRDANGKLMVVYHGTPNGSTTIFDKAKTSEINDMGQGIYFSTNKGDASSYMGKSRSKKLYSTYVNIKAPFVVSDNVKITVSEAASLLKLCDDRSLALDVYRGDVLINAKDGYITTSQLANTNISQQMTKILEKSGKYDGIIDETVSVKFGLEKGTKHIIALNSNQIKSVDNQKPTSNPDIRYSSQETDLDMETDSVYDGAKKETKQEVKTDVTREEVSHGVDAESQGKVGKENSGRESSERESCERRIKEILREKVFSRGNKSTSGRGRVETKENRADFESRVRNDGLMYVEAGGNALAFKVATTQNKNASIAASTLRKFRFDVVVFDGNLQHNGRGVTEISDAAITVPSAGNLTIFISSELDIDGMETAYHEAFHATRHGLFAKYHEKIANIIASNVDIESEVFEQFVSVIADLYAYTVSDVSTAKFEAEIIEEFYAWYVGKTYATQSGDMQEYMAEFSDVETIKEQIDGVYAQMEANADKALPGLLEGDMELYSSQETDADNAPTFYSQMGKVVEGMKQEKFGASSVISMLRGRGVKSEEIRWSGIQAFLDGKKSVTKQELLDFINSSMLHIEETMLDGSKGDPVKLPNNYRLEETENGMGDPILNLYIDDELVDTFEQIFDGSISSTGDSDIWAMNEEDLTGQILSYYAGMSYDEAYGNGSKETRWDKYTLDGGENYRELLFKMPGAAYSNQAMEAHWDDRGYGVLAHARIQDFNTFIGKMLFIEEIQSDWHNAGHKGGYRVEGAKDKEYFARKTDAHTKAFFESNIAKVVTERISQIGYEGAGVSTVLNYLIDSQETMESTLRMLERRGATFTDSEVSEIRRYAIEMEEIYQKWQKAPGIDSPPEAPFSSNYHEYVLKRLLRMAAEEGYDSIGWTTADIQIDRWSKEYAEGYRIEYDQDIPKFLKKYGKQWGSTVGKTVLDNGTEVWSMAITDAMQKSVLKEGQAMYSSQETDLDVGYHAGDLGKAESLRQQGLGRDTGHFGTGTYFVGNKADIEGYNSRNGNPAPVETVDFDKYKLFKPKNAQDGFVLHDFLRGVDGYWNRDADAVNTMEEYESLQEKLSELVYDIESEEFGETDPSKESWMAVEREFLSDAKRMMGDYKVGKALTDTLSQLVDGNYQYDPRSGEYYSYDFDTDQFTPYTENDIIQKLNAEEGGWKAYEGIEKLADDYYSYSRTSRYETWSESIKDVAKVLGISEQQVRNVFQSVTEDITSRGYTDADMETADSAATRFMKALGYEGIDVRGIKELDNTSYGSVIYDLKGEDLARKKAIGTARYSTQETDNISNRSLLANAFEGITQNSEEYKLIQEYKGRIKLLNEQEEKLAKLNAEIRKIRFGTDGEYDAKKLKELEAEAKNVAKAINRHDKKLLSLEASEPLRKVIEQERKKEAQRTKDHVKEIQQNKKVRAEQTELRHKIRKTIRDLDKILNRGNKKLNVKEDMKGFVSKALELADYLFTDHISNDDLIRKGITVRMTPKEAALVKETEDILSQLYDNADDLTDEEFTRLDAKRKSNLDKLRDLLTAQRNERLNTPVYDLFNDLVTEYASLKNSKQDAVRAAYNVDLERLLRQFMGDTTDGTDSDRKKLLQNMRVADMTTSELQKLYDAYKAVLTNVRDANKVFVMGKIESIDKAAEKLTWDFSKRKIPDKKLAIVARNIANKIGWDYEKLYYALDRIGSETFTELVMNIADSENIVMKDVMEAAAFRDEVVEKYGFNNWDVNKEIDREFLDNTGKKFKLTLGQMMALYAYSRREGAWDHIEYGGFVFGKAALTNPKPADSYKLSKAQCEAITNLLTKEQKSYAEDMQKYLSETMGAKGNEVSMLLYGIKMFGEKNYFPIHIAGQFKAQANESQAKAAAGFSTMTNAGFTHAQNPNAKAPFVLEGFNEIWADHVNEMSRYHGTVPALEDMRRVMNRSSYSETGSESMAIKQLMENSFGKEAVEYFDNLYREANSGAITDKLQEKSKRLLSMFRKNSVAYSLSVLIQQPAAMVRAYDLIDRKYFGFKGFGALSSGIAKAVSNKWTKAHTNAYNEMLKYAPGVTMAKEIGGFDTHTGGSIRSYLLDTNKKFGQKLKTGTVAEKGKAVLDLVDDNAVANLPNLADKIAWIEIWNACKRETVAKHKDLVPTSDEFMQIVGDRFTEVIRATQVYDSMFSKSPMLKSKNLAVQYLVSFMNEPNTVVNMAEKAVRDVTKGDWKGGVKTAAVVIHSIIFTNALKSIVYAMRDDDEDETYIEKYLEAVAGGLMGDFNPFSYIPLVRDAWSKAQGFDVERPDMAIIIDAIEAVQAKIKNDTKDTENMTEEQLVELDKSVTEANWKLVESLAAFFGFPVKNIRREIEGVIDHARIASANAGKTTKQSAWEKIRDAVIDSIPFMQSKNTKQDKLYDAIIIGDKDYLARIKSTYKDDSAYQTAVRKALRENDSRIHDAAQARYEGRTEEYKRIFREIQKEGRFSFDDIMSAINSEESKIRSGLEPEKATSSYTASDFVESIVLGDTKSAQAIKDDIIATKVTNGKTQEEAEKEFASNVSTGIRDAYSSGLLDETGAENMLMEYADKDEEEAASKVSYWAFCEEHPEYDLSESNVKDFKEFAEPAEIALDVFVQYINGTKGLADIKDEWGDVEMTKREQVLEVIDSLPLTWEQKDALYLAAGYSESKIWDVPW